MKFDSHNDRRRSLSVFRFIALGALVLSTIAGCGGGSDAPAQDPAIPGELGQLQVFDIGNPAVQYQRFHFAVDALDMA